MKKFNLFALGVIAVVGLAVFPGCHRRPEPPLTYIPGQTRPPSTDPTVAKADQTPPVAKADETDSKNLPKKTDEVVPLGDRELIEGMVADREAFKAQTVYFDFDRVTVKSSERNKLEAVAAALKGRGEAKVQIEGHCDERGTEEYNRSLGERRALAAREYLLNLGIGSGRVFTISYGEDKPAMSEHNEAAWAKNRRAEFILLLPKP